MLDEVIAKLTGRGMREHYVIPGENLQTISVKYFGTPAFADEIADVNRSRMVSADVYPGQRITIPYLNPR